MRRVPTTPISVGAWRNTDAEIFNADFADDVLWGTPFGMTVVGYAREAPLAIRVLQPGRDPVLDLQIDLGGTDDRPSASKVM